MRDRDVMPYRTVFVLKKKKKKRIHIKCILRTNGVSGTVNRDYRRAECKKEGTNSPGPWALAEIVSYFFLRCSDKTKKTIRFFFFVSYFFLFFISPGFLQGESPWETGTACEGSARRADVIFYNDVLMAEGRLSSATYPRGSV